MSDTPHRRRPRYSGKNPRHFDLKYKEQRGDPLTVAKVLEAGKTPAGTHRPILVQQILEILRPAPGEKFIDATLGYGGHTSALLPWLQPAGQLLALDLDPIEQPRTIARLRAAGFGEDRLHFRLSNFAGIGKAMAEIGWTGADGILADLGLSSMQIDDPARGFSVKFDGPLDMRMNPQRSISAAEFLATTDAATLATVLQENADEPLAGLLAEALAGKNLATTAALRQHITAALTQRPSDLLEPTIRRVFQAIRIAVNQEFSSLDAFLRSLPFCLNPGGRVAILTFHSGEDRRVKKTFQNGVREGVFSATNRDVIRPSPAEQHSNPRSAPAKLRWAIRH